MSTAATVVQDSVTVAPLQTSRELSGHLDGNLSGILQQQQQQQTVVMATPVTSQQQVS